MLEAAFDDVQVALDEGLLETLDDRGLLEFMRSFERLRNRLPLVDHHVVGDADRRRLAETLSERSTTALLVSTLRLSPAEASRRVHAAAACGPRRSMLGEPLDPPRPVLAAAQRAGEVSTEQLAMIIRALEPVDRAGFDPADVDAGERLLTGWAATFGPRELRGLVDRVVSAINPDGSRPDDELNADRRHFSMRATKDGAWVGDFRLTGALGAKLSAVLGPLSEPRPSVVGTCVAADGTEQPGCEVDPRTLPQRRHDALEEVCDRLLRTGTLPDTGGTPATVVVTIGLEQLEERVGTGSTSDGTPLSVAQLLALAGEAEIIPVVLARSGAVLDLGRTRRLASPSQTLALTARDGGCSFPGCAHPPEWCERHHVVAWADGGETNLDNLTLLCRYHHHNFLDRGWRCRIDEDGLPEWTPPAWVDRERRPLVNARILAARLSRRPRSLFALSG